MIRYCLDAWNKNENKLEQVYKTTSGWNECEYIDIVKCVVDCMFSEWDFKSITQIDNGDYQGTLLFLIPRNTYQPSEYDYLITYVGYGSCSGCDTLLSIQNSENCAYLNKQQIKDFMTLSKDIVMNMRRLYNEGWRYDEAYETGGNT